MKQLNDNEHVPAAPSGRGSKRIWIALAVVAVLSVTAYWLWQAGSREPAPQVAPTPAPTPEPEPAPEPEPPPPPTPTTGSLSISSSVAGASVYIDGDPVGEAPYRVGKLDPRAYEVRVEKDGYKPFERTVEVVAGQSHRVRANLERALASLRIASDIPGATVFLDRQYLGTAPLEAKGIEPGQHELTASVEGYDMYAETVEVTAEDRDVLIRFKEVKLDESVSVIHKHTMGSCRGTLRASVEGIRYETTNKKDAFSIPFSKLERFEIDYLEKNLNLRIGGGKNYNFTESSGNADALYVFHQKVREATEKLGELQKD